MDNAFMLYNLTFLFTFYPTQKLKSDITKTKNYQNEVDVFV